MKIKEFHSLYSIGDDLGPFDNNIEYSLQFLANMRIGKVFAFIIVLMILLL